MAHKLIVSEAEVFGKNRYVNKSGKTECVEFVRQATSIQTPTSNWRAGKRVLGSANGEISRGTAIATFDMKGMYPTDELGKHAAIYLEHDANGIAVLDQWNSQGEVKMRKIRVSSKEGRSRSNDPSTFCVIETIVSFA